MTTEEAVSILVGHRNGWLDAEDAERDEARKVIQALPYSAWTQRPDGTWALAYNE